MRARRWLLFIGLNIAVSVLATLGVLSFKGELERVVVVTATSGVISVDDVPTAIPVDGIPIPTASPTVPSLVEYTVQPGDTLSGIAFAFDVALEDLMSANNLTENSIITPDQVLIIPQDEHPTPIPPTPSQVLEMAVTATATPFPTETPTPPGPVQVRIQEVLAPGQLDREGVVLTNRGRTVNLQGWTLGAAGGELVFVFPRLTLAQDVPVTVYTIAGQDSPQALHWGLNAAQWGNPDTTIELRDAEGDLIATYTVPQ